MDKEYKTDQIYGYAEIKDNEKIAIDQYLGLLKQYDETLNNLKRFESVKDYIIFNKLKPNAKMVMVNGHVLSIKKRFNEIYFQIESE